MIPTEYAKVFFFFWLLLFLTETLISIFHILGLPIDSPNSVEATLEKLLSRAKGKKQMPGYFYGNQSFSPASSPTTCPSGNASSICKLSSFLRQGEHLWFRISRAHHCEAFSPSRLKSAVFSEHCWHRDLSQLKQPGSKAQVWTASLCTICKRGQCSKWEDNTAQGTTTVNTRQL